MKKITLTQTLPNGVTRSYSETVAGISNLSTLVKRLYDSHLLTCGCKRRYMDAIDTETMTANFYGWLRGNGLQSERVYDAPVYIDITEVEEEVTA